MTFLRREEHKYRRRAFAKRRFGSSMKTAVFRSFPELFLPLTAQGKWVERPRTTRSPVSFLFFLVASRTSFLEGGVPSYLLV